MTKNLASGLYWEKWQTLLENLIVNFASGKNYQHKNYSFWYFYSRSKTRNVEMKSIFVEKRHFELNAGVIWEMINLFLRSPKQKRCRELVAELYRIEKKVLCTTFLLFLCSCFGWKVDWREQRIDRSAPFEPCLSVASLTFGDHLNSFICTEVILALVTWEYVLEEELVRLRHR
jgi:hypothetical protein